MESFEAQLSQCRPAVERFVRFRLPSMSDAEDILQEVYITAYQKFDQLHDPAAFRPWILSIARNKCSDYFRARLKLPEVPIDALPEIPVSYGQWGHSVRGLVSETLEQLRSEDRQILRLYYWGELSQAEIAQRLGIPVGTVKSRLYTARQSFKKLYPYPPRSKGAKNMQKLPEIMPNYTITPSTLPPFSVKWEELMGWLIVPKLGEKLSWGLYEAPSGVRTEYTKMEVIGKAEVHGIEGVEFVAIQYNSEDYYRTGSIDRIERRFIAQLTDTHCRYLAESHVENGVRKCYTFLDGDSFLNNWGFGENNCGTEIHLSAKGILKREGNRVTGPQKSENLDIVGRYSVTIGGKSYDTVCVMDIETFNDAVASEQYLDKNGRTVLWRRFNRDDWAIEHFGGKLWSEKLPKNERLIINGETYVHWYDCLSDYVL